MQFLWKYIDEFVGKGLEAPVMVELLFYASANLVPLALPLAILLSSIMTFGNLGEHYELVAMKSAGMSLQRIMKPLIVFILMTSLGAFMFSNYIWPKANLKFASLLYDIRHKKPAINIEPNVFYKEIDDFVILARDKKEDGTLVKVRIYDHTLRNGARKVVAADEGTLKMTSDEKYLIVNLFNGNSYQEDQDKNQPLIRSTFKEEIIRFDLSEFQMGDTDEDLFKTNYQMLSMDQLEFAIDSLEEKFSNRIETYHRMQEKKILFLKDTMDLADLDSHFKRKTEKEELRKKRIQDREVVKKDIRTDIQNGIVASFHSYGLPAVIDKKAGKKKKQPKPQVKKNVTPGKAPPQMKKGKTATPAKNDPDKKQKAQPNNSKLVKSENKKTNRPTVDHGESVALNGMKVDFMKNFTGSRQKDVIEAALNLARSNKQYVTSMEAEMKGKRKTINRHKIEWHRKLTLSVACIVLFFIGAPLGAIIRKGGLGMPVVVSVLFFLVFHMTSITGEKFIKEGEMIAWQGMWMATLFLMPIGIFLTYKATTDSTLLDAGSYTKFFRRIVDVVWPFSKK